VDTWNALLKHDPACRACSGFRRLEAGALPFAEAWTRHWPLDFAEVYSED